LNKKNQFHKMTEDGATLKTEPITKVKKVCNKEKQA
jgi:hypothetical protein